MSTFIKNEDKDKDKDKDDKKNDINLINSLKENYLSWTVMFIAAGILSYPDITSAFISVVFCYVWYYVIHRIQHSFGLNITNIIHNYHHDHSRTFLSDLTEIILEINFLNSILPYLYIFNIEIINIWVILLYTFMYITIHNINYTRLRVNNVHRLHHQSMHTNHGPDVCDIIFGTKSPLDTEVENTDHYIPNIIIGFIIVYFIQCMYEKSDIYKFYLRFSGIAMLSFSALLYVIFSTYLWFFVKYEKDKEKKIEKEREIKKERKDKKEERKDKKEERKDKNEKKDKKKKKEKI